MALRVDQLGTTSRPTAEDPLPLRNDEKGFGAAGAFSRRVRGRNVWLP